MNCCSDEHPHCCHSQNLGNLWYCDLHRTNISPELKGCDYYEAPGEHALRVAFQEKFDEFDRKILEYDLWRHELLVESIRDGILYAVVAFTAFALLVWWTA